MLLQRNKNYIIWRPPLVWSNEYVGIHIHNVHVINSYSAINEYFCFLAVYIWDGMFFIVHVSLIEPLKEEMWLAKSIFMTHHMVVFVLLLVEESRQKQFLDRKRNRENLMTFVMENLYCKWLPVR